MSAAIEVSNLTVQYGENTVLDGVSFSIEAGNSVGVIGPNGSGKSTLLKALLGLIPHDSGSIRLLGDDPENLAASDLGYIPQIRRVDASFPALAIEVVVAGIRGAWPARIHPPEREAALEALNKTGAIRLAERPVALLSGGEWQRVQCCPGYSGRHGSGLQDHQHQSCHGVQQPGHGICGHRCPTSGSGYRRGCR